MGAILVPVDFSSVTPALVTHAAELAAALGHKVWLLHVAPPEPDFVGYGVGPQPVREHAADHLREEHRQLQALAERLKNEGVEVESLLVQGPVAQEVLEQAERLKAAMIVLGSHGRGALYQAVLGSVSADIVRHARCPVLVVPIRPG